MIFQVYHGYMDESGTHDQSDVVAVAGYLATVDQWNRFEEEWNRVMRHFCVEDFHMTDFEARQKEFAHRNYWTPEIRERFIERVTAVCQQHTLVGLGCAVVREQYEQILTPKIQGDLRHPYYFCLYVCLNMFLNLDDDRLRVVKPANFLFDQKKGKFRLGNSMISWEAYAQELYQRVKLGLDPEGKSLGALSADAKIIRN